MCLKKHIGVYLLYWTFGSGVKTRWGFIRGRRLFSNYFGTIWNFPYNIINLITNYLPCLNHCVTCTSMNADWRQTESDRLNRGDDGRQLSEKWLLILTYLLWITSFHLHCSSLYVLLITNPRLNWVNSNYETIYMFAHATPKRLIKVRRLLLFL